MFLKYNDLYISQQKNYHQCRKLLNNQKSNELMKQKSTMSF